MNKVEHGTRSILIQSQDLIVIGFWTAAACINILNPAWAESGLRIVLAFPLLFFIPGYLLISLFYPDSRYIEPLARLGLSIGLSVGVISIIGFLFHFLPWGIALFPLLVAVVMITVLTGSLVIYRRMKLPEGTPYGIDIIHRLQEGLTARFGSNRSRIERVTSMTLVCSAILAFGTVFLLVPSCASCETYTEFYVLDETGMVADYPVTISPGSSHDIILGISNHEEREVTYIIEVYDVVQQVSEISGEVVIAEMDRKEVFTVSVDHDETKEWTYSFSVDSGRYNGMRFLLFMDSASPADISGMERIMASYRDLHLWITVE